MLHVPAGALGFNDTEVFLTGQPVSTAGVVLTPMVGSKGAYIAMFAALAFDTYGLWIQIHNTATAAANRSYVVDVAIGAFGSEQVIIPDLIGSNANSCVNQGGGLWYFFPVFIPAGTRVAVRAQGSVITSCRVLMRALQSPFNPSMQRNLGHVERIGGSGILGVTVTPGTTSEGAWTLIGTTTRDLWWWQLGVQVAIASTVFVGTCTYFDIAVGNGTNFKVISEHISFATNTSEQCSTSPQLIGCEAFVPAGSSIYVRGQSSAAESALEVAVYGAG